MTGRALVVGYGSIGARHARVLGELGLDIAIASRRPVDGLASFVTVEPALDAFAPDYVVIADETSRHRETMARLGAAGFTGKVLVEKPLVAAPVALPEHKFAALAVGYQLRFHPAVQALRARLEEEWAIMALIEAGQHLSGWRPGRDWRNVYSASAAEGGGVLRDLSHELDLMLWLFGPWQRLAALGGNTGALAIEADEIAVLLAATARCPAISLATDYMARPARRRIVVETRYHTYALDLVAGTLATDGKLEQFETNRDLPFAAMHKAVLAGDGTTVCSAAEGLAVMDLVAAVERAIAGRTWIEAA